MVRLDGKYTTANIYAETIEEGVYGQVYDIINSKAFEGQTVVCMPDVHVGASGPCGLVSTIGNYVCPEHVGVDIGCTVSMMVLDKKILADKYAELEHRIRKDIPFGHEIHKKAIIDEKEFYKFLTKNFNKYRNCWYEMLSDLPDRVDEKWVSTQLKRIGMDEGTFYKSLGTVGGGNHFVEIDANDDFDAVTLHFGSRNFGLKVAKYWTKIANYDATSRRTTIKAITSDLKAKFKREGLDMKLFQAALNKEILVRSAGTITGYLSGEDMKGYLCDLCFAQLYAQYNHLTVQNKIKAMLKKYGINEVKTITTIHNFIDLTDHTLRKSAVRANQGEELVVPFNMRDGIAVCVGKGNTEWLNSCSHGAGRRMSRSEAKKTISLEEYTASMKDVYTTTANASTIDEAPMAYKDTDEIVKLITETVDIKYLMKPVINIKAAE